MLPGYYSMRRSFLPDSELCHPMKQYSPDTYSSALGSKAFTYDHPSSYSSFIDSYYNPDSYGDYRGPASYTTSGGSLFPPSSLPTLLPSLTGEPSSHLLLVDHPNKRLIIVTIFFLSYSDHFPLYATERPLGSAI